jgi:hypothetical protein
MYQLGSNLEILGAGSDRWPTSLPTADSDVDTELAVDRTANVASGHLNGLDLRVGTNLNPKWLCSGIRIRGDVCRLLRYPTQR